LCSRIDHTYKGKDAFERLDDLISDAVTCVGFVVGLATKAVIVVWV
jgi:hypothetical protein